MTDRDHEECLEAIRQDSERNQTREEAFLQLVKDGFITEAGDIHPNYR